MSFLKNIWKTVTQVFKPVVQVLKPILKPIAKALQPMLTPVIKAVQSQTPGTVGTQIPPRATPTTAAPKRNHEDDLRLSPALPPTQLEIEKLDVQVPDLSLVGVQALGVILDDPVVRQIVNMDSTSRSLFNNIVRLYHGDVAKAAVNFFGSVWLDEDEAEQLRRNVSLAGLSFEDNHFSLQIELFPDPSAGHDVGAQFLLQGDPCDGLTGEELDKCGSMAALETYGVTVGSAVITGEFNVQQLGALVATVDKVGVYLATEARRAGYDLLPQEAFRMIMGQVQFVYDPTLKDQPGLTQGQIVSLRPDAFYESVLFPDKSGLTTIPAHELGHIFQNRFGQTDEKETVLGIEVPADTPRLSVEYLVETGGLWYPFGKPKFEQVEVTDQSGQKRIAIRQAVDQNGNLLWEENLMPGYYQPNYIPKLEASPHFEEYFYNEQRDEKDPSEGFADTFAVRTMLGEEVFQGDRRASFMENRIPYWIRKHFDRAF